jgi:hypothetical protein
MNHAQCLTCAVVWLAITPAAARTFSGYECTVDCSGHKAGYEWAEARAIVNESECERILRRSPNRISFYEGCLAYVEDPDRGSDEDDDGEDID